MTRSTSALSRERWSGSAGIGAGGRFGASAAGGRDGARGTAAVLRKSGERVMLKGCDETDVAAGDAIEIETPGGGGFGKETP